MGPDFDVLADLDDDVVGGVVGDDPEEAEGAVAPEVGDEDDEDEEIPPDEV